MRLVLRLNSQRPVAARKPVRQKCNRAPVMHRPILGLALAPAESKTSARKSPLYFVQGAFLRHFVPGICFNLSGAPYCSPIVESSEKFTRWD